MANDDRKRFNLAHHTTTSKKKSPKMLIDDILAVLDSKSFLDKKNDVVTLREILSGEGEDYLSEFARYGNERCDENGLQLICRLFGSILEKLRNEPEDTIESSNLLSLLMEVVQCIRLIVNTRPGLELVVQRDSRAVGSLIEALCTINKRRPKKAGDTEAGHALRAETVKILASLGRPVDIQEPTKSVQLEMTGGQKILEELTLVSARTKQPRFKPILDCLRFCKETDLDHMILIIVNLLIHSSDRELSEDEAWRSRMALRFELMRDGFGEYIPRIDLLSKNDERICEVYGAFTSIQDDDFNELASRFKTLRGEYKTLEGCFEFLATTSANTAIQPVLLSIMQHFMIIPEDMPVRLSYFRMIESYVKEVVLHKNGVDPGFDSRFPFGTPVSENIEQLQDTESSRRLEQAVQAKQEAVAKQM